MEKHTPGPWNAYELQSDGTVPIVANAGGCPDAVLAAVGYDCPEHQIKANARLIAAAPNLLEACKAAQAVLVDGHELVWQKLTAAVAKAE